MPATRRPQGPPPLPPGPWRRERGFTMRLVLALGVAAAGLAFSAFAQTPPPTEQRMIVRTGGPMMGMDLGDLDANHDGWLSRSEAAAAADRLFAHLDVNHDGKLDDADHQAMMAQMQS